MFQFRAFGGVELVEQQGSTVREVILQPKQVAVLTYIATCPAGQPRARDTLLGMFWPEADMRHARAALRQTIHEIRKALGHQVIQPVGRNQLRLDPGAFAYDLWTFHDAIRDGDLGRAVAVRRGPFLDGFFLRDVPEFERWLEDERRQLDRTYCRALADLSESLAATGHLRSALDCANRWFHEEPYSGVAIRRLMQLSELAGDRAGALRAVDVYAARLKQDLGAEPEPEVLALAQRIRTEPLVQRGSARPLAPGSLPPAPEAAGGVGSVPPRVEPAATRTNVNSRRSALVVGIAVGLLALSAVAVWVSPSHDGSRTPRVLVRAYENATGDPMLDRVGQSFSRFIAAAVAELGTIDVIPPSGSKVRVTFVITGSYYLRGDSLEFLTDIMDVERGRALPPPKPVRAPRTDPLAGAEEAGHRLMAALGYYTSIFGAAVTPQRRPPSYEAFLAFSEGLGALFRFEPSDGEVAFRRAIELDPTYTEAYMLLAGFSFYNQPGPATPRGGLLGRYDAMDSLAGGIRRTINPLTEADRFLLQWLEAAAQGDLQAALAGSARLAEWLPAANYGIGFRGVWANRPHAAIEGLRRLDPDRGWIRDWWWYWGMLAAALHQLGNYDEELRVTAEGLRRFPTSAVLLEANLRARLALGDVEQIPRYTTQLSAPASLRVGLELRAHGHTAESNLLLMRVLELTNGQPGSVSERILSATALLTLGRLEEVVAELEQLVREHTLRLDLKGMLAIAYARQGNRGAALELSQELSSVTDEYLHGLPKVWRARIGAQLGDPDAAVELLAQSFREGVIHNPLFPEIGGTFWHTDPYFEPLRGYGSYEDLIRPR